MPPKSQAAVISIQSPSAGPAGDAHTRWRSSLPSPTYFCTRQAPISAAITPGSGASAKPAASITGMMGRGSGAPVSLWTSSRKPAWSTRNTTGGGRSGRLHGFDDGMRMMRSGAAGRAWSCRPARQSGNVMVWDRKRGCLSYLYASPSQVLELSDVGANLCRVSWDVIGRSGWPWHVWKRVVDYLL